MQGKMFRISEVRIIIGSTVTIGIVNDGGNTPFDVAIAEGRLDIVKHFIKTQTVDLTSELIAYIVLYHIAFHAQLSLT